MAVRVGDGRRPAQRRHRGIPARPRTARSGSSRSTPASRSSMASPNSWPASTSSASSSASPPAGRFSQARPAAAAASRRHRPGTRSRSDSSAEDPAREFAPAPGRIGRWRMPAGPGVRVDAAWRPGSASPPDYDPLIAKLMVEAPDRAARHRAPPTGTRRGRGHRRPDDAAVPPPGRAIRASPPPRSVHRLGRREWDGPAARDATWDAPRPSRRSRGHAAGACRPAAPRLRRPPSRPRGRPPTAGGWAAAGQRRSTDGR